MKKKIDWDKWDERIIRFINDFNFNIVFPEDPTIRDELDYYLEGIKKGMWILYTYIRKNAVEEEEEEGKYLILDEDGKIRLEMEEGEIPEFEEEEEKYTCKYCGKELNTKKGKEIHETRWCDKKEEKGYECKYCGRRFDTFRGKKIHEIRWCEEKEGEEYECEVCGKEFDSERGMKIHKTKNHKKEKEKRRFEELF